MTLPVVNDVRKNYLQLRMNAREKAMAAEVSKFYGIKSVSNYIRQRIAFDYKKMMEKRGKEE